MNCVFINPVIFSYYAALPPEGCITHYTPVVCTSLPCSPFTQKKRKTIQRSILLTSGLTDGSNLRSKGQRSRSWEQKGMTTYRVGHCVLVQFPYHAFTKTVEQAEGS